MITIGFLADYLDTIPTLANWFRDEWPDYFAKWSQAELEADFLEDASRDRLPIRLVAFDSGELAGTIILRPMANKALAEFQPELGGLYVPASHRRHGIGSQLVQSGMTIARDLGYKHVYATTTAAANILERLGWQFVKTAVYADGEHSLYGCKL